MLFSMYLYRYEFMKIGSNVKIIFVDEKKQRIHFRVYSWSKCQKVKNKTKIIVLNTKYETPIANSVNPVLKVDFLTTNANTFSSRSGTNYSKPFEMTLYIE